MFQTEQVHVVRGSLFRTLLLVAAFAPSLAEAESFNFIGVSNGGDDVVVSGKFSGADVDNDGVLEHPNGLLELSLFDAQATLDTGSVKVKFPWDLSHLAPFAFTPSGNSGLLSLTADEDSFELIQGNEIRNDSTLTVVNAGSPDSHQFHTDLELRVATDTYSANASGPMTLIKTISDPGLGYLYAAKFGNGGTPLDGATLLGGFHMAGVSEFSHLMTDSARIGSSQAALFDASGRQFDWDFESGMFNAKVAGGADSNVEVHYQCGSPDITCWGSINDFLDLMGDAEEGEAVDATSMFHMATMDSTGGMQSVPVESAWLIALQPNLPILPGDYNGNGAVDAADYTLWRDSLGQAGLDLAADGNGNLAVDVHDYLHWKGAFQDPSQSVSVPEPASMVCLLFLLIARGSDRHRK